MPQQKITLKIPRELNHSQREAVADKAIDWIISRTNRGIDKNGDRFTPYSKSYAGSKNFSIAGKTKGLVNLRLTGELHNGLQLLGHSAGRIVIGYKDGSGANDKAQWAAASDNGPVREFLGLSQDRLDRIVREVATDTQGQQVNSILDNLLSGLSGDNIDILDLVEFAFPDAES